jgi:hypothetical protein
MPLPSELIERLADAGARRELGRLLDALAGARGLEARVGDWTPTVTQGVAVTVTVSFARYTRLGQRALVTAGLSVTSAGTVGNAIKIGGQPAVLQPVHVTSTPAIGAGYVLDAGTAWYQGTLVVYGASDWRLQAHGLGDVVGVTPNFALANGDLISFACAYEVV